MSVSSGSARVEQEPDRWNEEAPHRPTLVAFPPTPMPRIPTQRPPSTSSWPAGEQTQPLEIELPSGSSPTLGDSNFWTSVCQRNTPRLRRIGRTYRLNDADTDDALQVTWLALFRHGENVRDPERLAGWLNSTMRRACLRILTSGCRRRDNLVGDWDGLEAVRAVPVLADDSSTRLETAELNAHLWSAVERLTPRHRDLLKALFSADEPSYADVSARLGIPVGSIGPTRQQALRSLRELMADSPGALSSHSL